jgi:hypothetical protein
MSRIINGEDIVKFIKALRIRWLGHVKRMKVGATPRKKMEGRLLTGRRKGRQWTEKTNDREQWRLAVEEAKAHPGL